MLSVVTPNPEQLIKGNYSSLQILTTTQIAIDGSLGDAQLLYTPPNASFIPTAILVSYFTGNQTDDWTFSIGGNEPDFDDLVSSTVLADTFIGNQFLTIKDAWEYDKVHSLYLNSTTVSSTPASVVVQVIGYQTAQALP